MTKDKIELTNEYLKHLNNIFDANNNNRLVIFVGSGFSKNSESNEVKLPNWSELIDDLKKDLGGIEEQDNLKIAQLYFHEFGEHTYYSKIKKFFPDNIKPSERHQKLFEFNPHCIITTNWDNILENEIYEGGRIFDVICCDEDLVKSTIQKKVIKMHGDFSHHNIVFKEDDYLNYSINFPLIENFIKSILSTHVVLFVGYSYNDINLKQIVKWRQNTSKIAPPHYLLSSKNNKFEEKYLEGYGIKVLKEKERNYILDTILNHKKFNIDDENILKYFVDKLKYLDSLNVILLDQVITVLTNCMIVYSDNNKAYLELLKTDGILTYDYDENTRNINEKFIAELKQHKDKKLLNKTKISYIDNFLKILKKANIQGVILDADTFIETALQIENHEDLLNFDWFNSSSNKLIAQAFNDAQLKNYDEAFIKIEKVVIEATKSKNYSLRMFCIFNANILLYNIKYDFKKSSNNNFKERDEYELKNWFNDLSKDLKNQLEVIYQITNFEYLYKIAFKQYIILEKKEKIKNSKSIIFDANQASSNINHENLLFFILGNYLMLDNYKEFKTIMKYFIKTSFVQQFYHENTILNRAEIFSCIKYLEKDDLYSFLKENRIKESYKEKCKISISDNDKEWLLKKAIPQIMTLLINTKNNLVNFDTYLNNSIQIISELQLKENELNDLLNIFKNTIHASKFTICLYESLSTLLEIQYNLYNAEIDADTLKEIIDVILYKFAYRTANSYDYQAISKGLHNNLINYASNKKLNYDNQILIDRFLYEICTLDIEIKIFFTKFFIIGFLNISNDNIKKNIINFIEKINRNEIQDQNGDRLEFLLILIVSELKTVNELKDEIKGSADKYLSQFENMNCFSSRLYDLYSLFDSINKKLENSDFDSYFNKIENFIKSYEYKNKHLLF